MEMEEVKGIKIESYVENDAEGNKSETDGIEISIYR